jgi:hypothetical protein
MKNEKKKKGKRKGKKDDPHPDEPGINGSKAKGALLNGSGDLRGRMVKDPPIFHGAKVGGKGKPTFFLGLGR